MKHNFSNQYGRVILSPLTIQDVEALRILRNRERSWFVYSKEIDFESQVKWYEKYLITPNDYMFSIAQVYKPKIFIGAVALYNVNIETKTCEFGRIIIDKTVVSDRGLGYDATMCACKIGFQQFGMQQIILEVFNNNIKAIITYSKAGFTKYSEEDNIIKMILTKNTFDSIKKREEEVQ